MTSYFSFRGEVARPLAAGLLEDLWLHVLGLRSGLVVESILMGPEVPGRHDVRMKIGNSSGTRSHITATLRMAFGDAVPSHAAADEATVEPWGHAEFKLPYAVTERGKLSLSLDLTNGDRNVMSLDRVQSIPEMVEFAVKDRHVYPVEGRLAFSAAFTPDAEVSLDTCRGQLVIDGKLALDLKPLKPAGDYSVGVSKLAVGKHRARLRLVHAGRELGAKKMEFYRYATPRVYSRSDGTTIVNRKPFFPFGWYHVSWSFTSEERLQCLRDIAAGGFNALHAGIKQIDEWEPLLEEAEKLGVHVVTEFGVDSVKVITRYRDKKAVLAWNPGDEPDGGGVAPEEMLRRFDSFKLADPEHPTYMTLCVPQTYSRYAGCAEVIAPDPYPIPHSPTSAVYDILSQARTEAAKYGRPVWGILQCFGYEKGPWRVPTFAECRNMTYLALLAGVKGIIYYTYADTGFKVTDHPDLWRDMQTLPAEIRTLTPFLLGSRLVKLETGHADVFAGAWTRGKRVVVCVVNTSPKESRQVDLILLTAAKGPARPLFAGRPSGLVFQKGRLRGAVGGMEVEVCELTR
ncbi:MAG: hypothetical protein HY318_18925 [Armatimonadetes bacterium]|nr:hypothetical protein [Armatimonadota bacterium]